MDARPARGAVPCHGAGASRSELRGGDRLSPRGRAVPLGAGEGIETLVSAPRAELKPSMAKEAQREETKG